MGARHIGLTINTMMMRVTLTVTVIAITVIMVILITRIVIILMVSTTITIIVMTITKRVGILRMTMPIIMSNSDNTDYSGDKHDVKNESNTANDKGHIEKTED